MPLKVDAARLVRADRAGAAAGQDVLGAADAARAAHAEAGDPELVQRRRRCRPPPPARTGSLSKKIRPAPNGFSGGPAAQVGRVVVRRRVVRGRRGRAGSPCVSSLTSRFGFVVPSVYVLALVGTVVVLRERAEPRLVERRGSSCRVALTMPPVMIRDLFFAGPEAIRIVMPTSSARRCRPEVAVVVGRVLAEQRADRRRAGEERHLVRRSRSRDDDVRGRLAGDAQQVEERVLDRHGRRVERQRVGGDAVVREA